MRLQLPAPIRDPLLGAIGRLELSFDVSLSIKRVKRYGWIWRRDWEYAVGLVVSHVPDHPRPDRAPSGACFTRNGSPCPRLASGQRVCPSRVAALQGGERADSASRVYPANGHWGRPSRSDRNSLVSSKATCSASLPPSAGHSTLHGPLHGAYPLYLPRSSPSSHYRSWRNLCSSRCSSSPFTPSPS